MQYATGLVRLSFLGCLLAAGVARAAGCPDIEPIPQATRTVTADGQAQSAAVPLPDSLPIAIRSQRHAIRYDIDVSACAGDAARAFWLFRAGAPYRALDEAGRPLALLGSGVTLRAADALGLARPDAFNGRIPALFALPAGTRKVTIELLTLPYIPTGLVAVRAGPADALLPVHEQALREVLFYADTASGIVLVLGLFAVLLWTQRRQDESLLWLSVACALWGLRGIAYYNPQVYVGPFLFEMFNPANALATAVALAAALAIRLGVMTRRMRHVLAGVLAVGVGTLVMTGIAGQGAFAARALSNAFGMGILGWLLWIHGRRWRQPTSLVLALSIGALTLTLLHDLGVVAGLRPPDSPSVVFWGFAVLLMGISALSGQYVVGTLNRAERANEELAQRIAEKSSELEHSYAQLREREQEQARTAERERLVRDLHDGLSAHLVTTLRGVERGALAQEAVAGSLQESLDELRMLMDSSDLGHYLPGALAAWRNRWESRVEAAGVRLGWHIDDSVDAIEVAGNTTLQIMRILQEAAANVVKHAKAGSMQLSARVVAAEGGEELCIEVVDDGVGLPASAPGGASRGLRNMAHRAGQLGGRLEVGPGPQGRGTVLLLAIPLQATSPRRLASSAASARELTPSLR